MAISVNWPTKVINIPQADLTFIGGQIYELDTNAFHLTLRDLEDDIQGMPFVRTHKHNTTVLLGGIEYARIIEIINGYTVTFEDGQYAVNLVGSNNNIADITNVNQVSVRPNNSAGLIQTREIQYASFNGGVTLDVVNGTAGTVYPTGTPRQPAKFLADAMFIASLNGFGVIYVIGDAPIDSGGNYQGMTFIGESKSKSVLDISSLANVLKCEFYEAYVTGTLDGDCVVKGCQIDALNYIWGFIEQCVLSGTVSLGGAQPAHFLDCYSGVPGSNIPIIDCGGDGPPLAVRNYSGGIKLTNKSGVAAVSIDLDPGQVVLDNTVTAGEIVVRGVGKLVDTAGDDIPTGTWNGVTIINETLNGDGTASVDADAIATAVWDYTGP